MLRAPVSLKRLQYGPDGMVTYRGKYNPALGRDYQHVSGLEFLAMCVPHILLRYENVIRTYGAISTKLRVKFGWVYSDTLSDTPDQRGGDDGDVSGQAASNQPARLRSSASARPMVAPVVRASSIASSTAAMAGSMSARCCWRLT